jgi:cytochrome c oxidase assembly protein subunit 19
MGGTPASRTLVPRAPEKGVFPLDHFGECKAAMSDYMACLRDAAFATEACRGLSQRYLECRMSRCVTRTLVCVRVRVCARVRLCPPRSPARAAAAVYTCGGR